MLATSVSNAAAEESGWFAGAQLGYGGVSARAEYSQFAENTTTLDTYIGSATADSGWQGGGSLRYGILGGYKHFITPKFGLRFYGAFDYGSATEHKITGAELSYVGDMVEGGSIKAPNSKAKLNFWKLNLNVDALYDFISRESLDFGVFAGLSLGYVSGAKAKAAYNEAVRAHNDSLIAADYNIFSTLVYPYDEELSVDGGFDFAINLGLRANIAKHHGIELYSRFAFVRQEGKHTYEKFENYEASNITNYDSASTTIKLKQPYAVGLRYVFSF